MRYVVPDLDWRFQKCNCWCAKSRLFIKPRQIQMCSNLLAAAGSEVLSLGQPRPEGHKHPHVADERPDRPQPEPPAYRLLVHFSAAASWAACSLSSYFWQPLLVVGLNWKPSSDKSNFFEQGNTAQQAAYMSGDNMSALPISSFTSSCLVISSRKKTVTGKNIQVLFLGTFQLIPRFVCSAPNNSFLSAFLLSHCKSFIAGYTIEH